MSVARFATARSNASVVGMAALLASTRMAAAQVALWEWPAGQSVGGAGYWVHEMLAWDDGNGPGLFVGGLFTKVGGKEIPWIARWNGKEWSAVGTGLEDVVNQMLVFDDGAGPALFAIGAFQAPSSHIAKWNGIEWLPVGAGFVGPLRGMTVYDDGAGAALYVGGSSKVSSRPLKNPCFWRIHT